MTGSFETFTSGVAGRYASALFELAQDARSLDAVQADLKRFEALLEQSEDLQRLVKSPVFTSEEQERAMDALLKKVSIGGLAGNFIRLAASKRRLFALPDMIKAYSALVAQSKGIVSAEIRLAEQPSERVLNEIKATLKQVAGSEIDATLTIDPSLIGGMVVKIGSKMVDASLKTKLNSIRIAMKEAS